MSPWLALGIVLAWLGSLAGVGYWQNHQGHISERVVWQKRYDEEVTQAANQIKQLEEVYRNKEEAWNNKLNIISATYKRKLIDANQKFSSVSTGINSGSIRLLDSSASSVCSGSDSSSKASSSAGRSNAASGCELSAETSRNLWQLAEQADATAERLSACQAIINLDRQEK